MLEWSGASKRAMILVLVWDCFLTVEVLDGFSSEWVLLPEI
jgi:hypothetical protein